MKKREIAIDLTAMLDVFLIILFSILVLNAGQLDDYKANKDEAERQLGVIEQELDKLEKQRSSSQMSRTF